MKPQLVSIALCTYNGAKYLGEQLDTLINQTHADCEIIICDDCSKDGTAEILKQYAGTYPHIKLYFNEENLGYTKNFEKAISLCNGDYIALCDQDDVWETHKISIMLGHIGTNVLAYHDSAFIDEKGNTLNRKLSDVRNCYSGEDSRVFLFDNCVLGHATMFKKELLSFIGKFNDLIIHDRWLAYVAANNGGIIFINQPLVQYRQHFNANTNILKQERAADKQTSGSIAKMQFQLDVTTVFTNYPYNNFLPFKKRLLELLNDRMHSYTSFTLAWFIFRHQNVLFYIQKKSAISRFNRVLKYIWGYKLKRLSLFNTNS